MRKEHRAINSIETHRLAQELNEYFTKGWRLVVGSIVHCPHNDAVIAVIERDIPETLPKP